MSPTERSPVGLFVLATKFDYLSANFDNAPRPTFRELALLRLG
jgi:hypothetical protein